VDTSVLYGVQTLEHLIIFMKPVGEGVVQQPPILHKMSSSRYDLQVLMFALLSAVSDASRRHVSTSKDAPSRV
jgi:hypothetical protein